MKTTIDQAGRVVIPKPLRVELGLVPGEVQIVVDGDALRITAVDTLEFDDLEIVNGIPTLPKVDAPLTAADVRELRRAGQR